MSVEYTIVCDRCARVLDASTISAKHARLNLERDNPGSKVAQPGGKDYCSACALAPPDPEAAE